MKNVPVDTQCKTLNLASDADIGSCRQLKIQIDCVAEGTSVLMRDGTQKEIQNVKVGDQILGAEGEQPGTIINVWRGREDKMYCITTEDGSRLFLTGSHYVLTDAGMVMASYMHLGMQIRMGSGALQKIRELYTIDEETDVYNLSVDEGVLMPPFWQHRQALPVQKNPHVHIKEVRGSRFLN